MKHDTAQRWAAGVVAIAMAAGVCSRGPVMAGSGSP